MKQISNLYLLIVCAYLIFWVSIDNNLHGNPKPKPSDGVQKINNPISVSYLVNNLSKTTPRLILTPEIVKDLRSRIGNDPLICNYYKAVKLNSEKILTLPLLERNITGRRLLLVSREMLYRINILGIIYLMENDPAILERINQEVIAVCNFSDWNPSHYLDVAEMAMAVAFAVDWLGNYLQASTVDLALNALIEKGINPSYEDRIWWIRGASNWNQVCNAGMIAASIAIAEKDPDLAARTISRSLDGIPYALDVYRPNGVYPEGPMYWDYGTKFTILTSSMLTSSFGTDFGITNYPAFMETANFRMLTLAPSGLFWNFADCRDSPGRNGSIVLAWFAARTGNALFLEREKFMIPPESWERLNRTAAAGLVWLSQFEETQQTKLPLAWLGDGSNPIVVFRNGENDRHKYYFGGKGGRATLHHGHMDAGSFIFELDSVRWSVELGIQDYHLIERTGFNLFNMSQNAERWKLLSTNNFGHSTLSVNDQLFVIDAYVPVIDFRDGDKPEFTINMTDLYGENIKSAKRRFFKEDERSINIEDVVEYNDNTINLTWQMITTADVEIADRGAVLWQDGKMLRLELLSHPGLSVSVVPLDPPPFYLDKRISGLKRIEIRIPGWISETGTETIRVRLNGN
jgi:hypothetical protein